MWPSAARCSTASRAPSRSSAVADGSSAVVEPAVDEHDRQPGRRHLVEQAVVEPRGRGDHAVDLPRAHRLEVVALALGVVVGVGDQRRVAGLLEPVLDPAHDRREQRVGEVGDEHADRVRPARLQPARDRVRPVAERLGRLDHAQRRLLVDQPPRLRVQRARHRARVHGREPRDVAQRRRGGAAGHARHYARGCSRSRTAPLVLGVASRVSASSAVLRSDVTSRSSGSVPPTV